MAPSGTDARGRFFGPPARIIGRCAAMVKVRREIPRLARLDTPVLLTAEDQREAELVARAIHEACPARAGGELFMNDIAPFPPVILESEVFGHERGAFEGAVSAHASMLEQARGGTICFRNFDQWPPSLEARLQRVLREKVIVRVGGDRPIPVDVRIIAIIDPRARAEYRTVSDGLLRAVGVERLNIPPLRERGDDIIALARHFAATYAASYGCRRLRLTAHARSCLRYYHWPGNVMELANVVERAYALWQCSTAGKRKAGLPDKRTIDVADLPRHIADPSSSSEA
jgi:Nif-specific regulatory protein